MKKYTVIKADFKKNKNDILEVLKRNLPDISEQGFSWNCEKCPQGSAQWWLAKDEDTDRFVGAGAVFPRKIAVNEHIVCAGVAGDFAVDKAHRAFGPAFSMQKNILEDMRELGYSFVYGMPNKLAETLLFKAGYLELGKYNKFVKILKTEYKQKTYLPGIPFTRKLSKLIDYAIKIISKENWHQLPLGFSVETPVYFDERFDKLWMQASPQFKVIGERNAKYLNWRYKQSSHQDYKIFALVKEKNDIAGYIIYYVQNKICYIADLLFLDSGRVIDYLLAELILHVRKNDVGSVSIRYLGSKTLLAKLKEFNFFQHKKENSKILINVAKTSQWFSFLVNASNWHFLEGDNDR